MRSNDLLPSSENHTAKQRRRGWLLALVGCALFALSLSLLVPGYLNASAQRAAQPTPTPTVSLPLRDYDPPAPRDLALTQRNKAIQTADAEGHPRIVKLWGGFDSGVGIDFYAQYDMMISHPGTFSDEQLLYLRDRNPNLRVLYSGVGTYDIDSGPLGSRWITATAGSPEFECFYRGTDDQVLRVDFWGHGMFNMGDEWCTDKVCDYLVSQVGPQIGEIYDGVFFDRVYQAITPYILNGIDLDHDGRVDNRDSVNELYWRGTERFLDTVRERLGEEVIVVANDAPLVYTSRLNGREYESFIRSILDGDTSWTGFRYDYEQWMQAAREPRLSMVMGNPPEWMEDKYGLPPWEHMKAAVVDEAAAYYTRMRFGLTTALLEGGLYSFEFGTTWHGNAWWYDEYDGAGLGKGYLGASVGEAYHATGLLTTTNAVQNPGFEGAGLSPWTLYTQEAQASLSSVPISAPLNTILAARLVITSSEEAGDVQLRQANVPIVDDQEYTLSFWGKASAQLWDIEVRLHPGDRPSAHYGLKETLKLGTMWQQYWAPFVATATASDAVLSFIVGGYTGTVWIDEVRLQQGALPAVYRRDFERGSVLCNTTEQQQEIPLGGTYYKIDGTQAPLVKILIDDTERSTDSFVKIGGWAGHEAGDDDWGDMYHHALTTSDPGSANSSVVWRPNIPYADEYAVFAWIAPHPKFSDTVTYTVQHVGGYTSVSVAPAVSEPTWANLGSYAFDVGTGNCVTLTNYSASTWVVADAVKFESARRYNDGAEVTSVVLEGQDGIVLLGSPPGRADLVKTASDATPFAGDSLTFTLRFRRMDVGTQTLQVRVADASPAPSYLEILTPSITGGGFYSPTIDGVVWEGELDPGSPPIQVAYQVRITHTVPAAGYLVTNTATMVDLSTPGAPTIHAASTRIQIERKPEHNLFLPLVLKQ